MIELRKPKTHSSRRSSPLQWNCSSVLNSRKELKRKTRTSAPDLFSQLRTLIATGHNVNSELNTSVPPQLHAPSSSVNTNDPTPFLQPSAAPFDQWLKQQIQNERRRRKEKKRKTDCSNATLSQLRQQQQQQNNEQAQLSFFAALTGTQRKPTNAKKLTEKRQHSSDSLLLQIPEKKNPKCTKTSSFQLAPATLQLRALLLKRPNTSNLARENSTQLN